MVTRAASLLRHFPLAQLPLLLASLPLSHCQATLSIGARIRPAVSPLTSGVPLLMVTDQVSCKEDTVPPKQGGAYLWG